MRGKSKKQRSPRQIGALSLPIGIHTHSRQRQGAAEEPLRRLILEGVLPPDLCLVCSAGEAHIEQQSTKAGLAATEAAKATAAAKLSVGCDNNRRIAHAVPSSSTPPPTAREPSSAAAYDERQRTLYNIRANPESPEYHVTFGKRPAACGSSGHELRSNG